MMKAVEKVFQYQNDFFKTGKTLDLDFRKEQLKKLENVLRANEKNLYEAIYKDFRKSEFETYTTELSFIYNEIKFYIKNLKKLSKPEKVKTNLSNFPGSSYIYKDPYGKCLVIGAWNYPYQLSLLPFVCAIASGNVCILKPSEMAENTSKIMAKLINENFPEDYLYVAEGGVEITTELLELNFDKIFFTGSPKVGKIVYEAAAKNLTPVTLELGGKSPVIVSENSDLAVAARRIVWGKFLNAGQTCIAPDFVLVHKNVKSKFIDYLKKYLDQFDYQENASHYTNIINSKNFQRLEKLIDDKKVIYGNHKNFETNFISPTILDNVSWEDDVMQEEIFGPILPILTYENFQQTIDDLKSKEKPLSAYLFSDDEDEKSYFLNHFSFGGGCVNDVLMHIGNGNLPFGGVGNSGIGNYHGKFGFDAFVHQKAILKRKTWGEPNLKYPPYSEKKISFLKRFL